MYIYVYICIYLCIYTCVVIYTYIMCYIYVYVILDHRSICTYFQCGPCTVEQDSIIDLFCQVRSRRALQETTQGPADGFFSQLPSNATSPRWHLWKIDSTFALNSAAGWVAPRTMLDRLELLGHSMVGRRGPYRGILLIRTPPP